MASRTQRFERLYSQIPRVHCKGLCHGDCSIVTCSTHEHRRLFEQEHPSRPQDPLSCPFLKDERCSAYDRRPTLCRLYGATEGLTCSHGCEVEGPLLTKARGHELLQLAEEIGGPELLLNYDEDVKLVMERIEHDKSSSVS